MSGDRTIICPWCPKRFPDLSARFQHARASHTGRDLKLVEFDVIGGAQVGRFRSIGEVVAPIVERATK